MSTTRGASVPVLELCSHEAPHMEVAVVTLELHANEGSGLVVPPCCHCLLAVNAGSVVDNFLLLLWLGRSILLLRLRRGSLLFGFLRLDLLDWRRRRRLLALLFGLIVRLSLFGLVQGLEKQITALQARVVVWALIF